MASPAGLESESENGSDSFLREVGDIVGDLDLGSPSSQEDRYVTEQFLWYILIDELYCN